MLFNPNAFNSAVFNCGGGTPVAPPRKYPAAAGSSKKKHKPKLVLTDSSVEAAEALEAPQKKKTPKVERIEVEAFAAPYVPSPLKPFVFPESRDFTVAPIKQNQKKRIRADDDDDEVLLLL